MGAEKNFENKVKRYLKSKGIYYVKFFANGFTRAGVPDLLCCINGRFVGLEIKSETGKASLIQLINIDQIKQSGGIACVVSPLNWDCVKHDIEQLLKI